MLEAFTISSDSQFDTLMILTEKNYTLEFRILDIKFIWITLSYFDMANGDKVVLGYVNKMM